MIARPRRDGDWAKTSCEECGDDSPAEGQALCLDCIERRYEGRHLWAKVGRVEYTCVMRLDDDAVFFVDWERTHGSGWAPFSIEEIADELRLRIMRAMLRPERRA